jgi:hypothetical protein
MIVSMLGSPNLSAACDGVMRSIVHWNIATMKTSQLKYVGNDIINIPAFLYLYLHVHRFFAVGKNQRFEYISTVCEFNVFYDRSAALHSWKDLPVIANTCKKYSVRNTWYSINSIWSKKSLKIHKGGNQNIQDNTMANEKGQKDKQRSSKHTHKTKDRVILVRDIPIRDEGIFFTSVSNYR